MKLRVVEGSLGLPHSAGVEVKQRPDWLMPAQSGDITLVTRAFVF